MKIKEKEMKKMALKEIKTLIKILKVADINFYEVSRTFGLKEIEIKIGIKNNYKIGGIIV